MSPSVKSVDMSNLTEPLAVLGSKAETYRSLATNGDWARAWSEQHGPLPVPLWVAPTKGRAEAIQRAWKRAWPEGEWLVTSDKGLERNELPTRTGDCRSGEPAALAGDGRAPAAQAAPRRAARRAGVQRRPSRRAPLVARGRRGWAGGLGGDRLAGASAVSLQLYRVYRDEHCFE